MRIVLLSALSVLFLAVSSGCADHMDAEGRMRDHLEAARQEVARHHQVSISAQTLEEMRLDVVRHETSMESIMSSMNGAMEDMSHCSGSAMSGMMEGMDGMQGAMMDHGGEMDGAATTEEARALCEHHIATMGSMMDTVESNMGDASCM